MRHVSHVVQHMTDAFLSDAVHFRGDDTWCGEMVSLVSRLRDEFNFHSSTIMRSFHRWAGTPIPIDEVNGGSFDDVYVRIDRRPSQRRRSAWGTQNTCLFVEPWACSVNAPG